MQQGSAKVSLAGQPHHNSFSAVRDSELFPPLLNLPHHPPPLTPPSPSPPPPLLQARTSPSGLPSSQWCRCCGNQLQRRQQPPATAAKHTPHTDDRGTSDRFWQPASRAPQFMPWLHVLWWRPPVPLRTALQPAPSATTLLPRSDPFCAIPLALL